MADALHVEGNVAMGTGNYALACRCYSSALVLMEKRTAAAAGGDGGDRGHGEQQGACAQQQQQQQQAVWQRCVLLSNRAEAGLRLALYEGARYDASVAMAALQALQQQQPPPLPAETDDGVQEVTGQGGQQGECAWQQQQQQPGDRGAALRAKTLSRLRKVGHWAHVFWLLHGHEV